MKKYFAVFLSLMLVCSLAACNGKDEEDKSAGSESTGTSKVEGYASSGFFDGVTVAAAVEDAFAGASSFGSGDSSFVSPTTSLKRGTMWYGTMAVTDFVGTNTEDYTKDVVAKLDATSQGWDYIEIYTDSSLSEEYIQLSMYITLYDDGFTADIGDEDAWIFSRYLTEEDAKYFSPSLNNGALVMTYPYVDEEEGYSCTVTFFLREDGTPWDEEHDLLPPSYERYKEAIGG